MGDCVLYLQPVYERLDSLDNMPYRVHSSIAKCYSSCLPELRNEVKVTIGIIAVIINFPVASFMFRTGICFVFEMVLL